MLMKVHRKGQVVIPAEIRRKLGIDVGDLLEVEVVEGEGKIELRVPVRSKASSLAGALKEYAPGRRFPSEDRMAEALHRGLLEGG